MGCLHLDDATPGLFLRPEATKARRADWLPILPALVQELEAARPVFWKTDTLVFRRGVTAPDTLRKDMTAAGIPLVDKLGRPVGIHTFRRSFISHLQKRGVHSRDYAAGAAQKSQPDRLDLYGHHEASARGRNCVTYANGGIGFSTAGST